MTHQMKRVSGRRPPSASRRTAHGPATLPKLGATRIMVIGYGFSDPHITKSLTDALPSGLQMLSSTR